MFFRSFVFLVAFIFAPALSFAGTIEQQPVYDRVQTGYEVPGARFGDVLVHPSAKLLELFNNNVYATQSNKKSDFVTTVAPQITAETMNKDRGFKAEVGDESGLYRNFTNENYNDVHANINPYLQVTKASKIDGKLSFERLHDFRTDEAASNNQGSKEPIQWSRSIGRLGWEYKPGRVGMTTFAEHALLRFDNEAALNGGATFVNKDRDRDEDQAGVVLSCDLTDQNKIYTSATGFSHDYEHHEYDAASGGFNGINRDSKGADLRIGSKTNITKLISFDINGGYYNQNFTDNRLQNVQTGVGKAVATWLITPLTTLDLSGERQVFETIQPDASAFSQNNFGVKITHELRRNIILGAEANTGVNSYAGSTRKDTYWSAGPSIIYRMNRNIDWKAEYSYDMRNSNQPSLDYDRQRVFVGIQVKF